MQQEKIDVVSVRWYENTQLNVFFAVFIAGTVILPGMPVLR